MKTEPETNSQVTTALTESKEAWFGGNFNRAWQVSRNALNSAPEGTSSADLAELTQICEGAKESVDEYQLALPIRFRDLEQNPASGATHYQIGTYLNALGQTDEAISRYRKALEFFDSMDESCQRELLNDIGWYHHVRGEFEEALSWFNKSISIGEGNANAPFGLEDVGGDTSAKTKNADPPYYLALENKLLTLTALGRVAQAKRTADQYIRHHGRIPVAEARALSSLGIDADRLFVDHEQKSLESAGWLA